MAPPSPTDLSFIGVLLVLFSAVLPPEFAAHAAVYAAILIAWFGGLLVGIARRPPTGKRYPILGYGLVTLICTVAIAVPASEWLAKNVLWLTGAEAQALVCPVAALIPAIGHNWVRAGEAIGRRAMQTWLALIGGANGGDR